MAGPTRSNPTLLGDLARIGAGLVVMGAVAATAREARQPTPRTELRPGSASFRQWLRNRPRYPRKPPESGMMAPAASPRGPMPQQGSAAAPLAFDN